VKPGVVVHAIIPALRRVRQEDQESEASNTLPVLEREREREREKAGRQAGRQADKQIKSGGKRGNILHSGKVRIS
jgi:hypothetical protein